MKQRKGEKKNKEKDEKLIINHWLLNSQVKILFVDFNKFLENS